MVSGSPVLIRGGGLDAVICAGAQAVEGEGGLVGDVGGEIVGARCLEDVEGVERGVLHRGPARVDGAVGLGDSGQLRSRHHCRAGSRRGHPSVQGTR